MHPAVFETPAYRRGDAEVPGKLAVMEPRISTPYVAKCVATLCLRNSLRPRTRALVHATLPAVGARTQLYPNAWPSPPEAVCASVEHIGNCLVRNKIGGGGCRNRTDV